MIDCNVMTDRMVPVAHGRAAWTDEEEAHLARCPDCAAGWRLVAAARQHGDSATRRLESARVSREVLARLDRERGHRRWRRMGLIGSLAAAALVTLVVWTDQNRSHPVQGGGDVTAQAFQLPLAELESLDAGELTTVLEGLEAPLGAEATPEAPGLGDLQDTELERVLRSLEG
jgi:hypothetical protein